MRFGRAGRVSRLLLPFVLAGCAAPRAPGAAGESVVSCVVEDGRVRPVELRVLPAGDTVARRGRRALPWRDAHPTGPQYVDGALGPGAYAGLWLQDAAWEPFALPRTMPAERAVRLARVDRVGDVPFFRDPDGPPNEGYLPVRPGCVFQRYRSESRSFEMQAVPADRSTLDSVAVTTGSCPGCEAWRAVLRRDGTVRWEGIENVRPLGSVVRPMGAWWDSIDAAARSLPDSLDRRYGPLRLHGGYHLALYFDGGHTVRTTGETLPPAARAIRAAALFATHQATDWEFVEPEEGG